eukprot:SAG31_NODE_154_length_22184_cov_25.917142_16_plen_108_part_00
MEDEAGWMWDAGDVNASMLVKDLLFVRDPDRDEQQYTDAIYFTFVTMSSVGYGDFSPKTVGERQWCVVTIVIAIFLNAYIIGAFRCARNAPNFDKTPTVTFDQNNGL